MQVKGSAAVTDSELNLRRTSLVILPELFSGPSLAEPIGTTNAFWESAPTSRKSMKVAETGNSDSVML